MADGVAQVGERVSLLKGSVALRNDNAAIEAPSEQLVVESLNMDASDYRAYSDICWLSEMPLMADIDGLLSEVRWSSSPRSCLCVACFFFSACLRLADRE